MFALAIGAFGTLIGSFLNVVIYRVPLGRSVVAPASACGHCGHAIRSYDNIPLTSWILLRGKCRDCGAAISARYPLVELAGGVLFALVAFRFVPVVAESTSVATAIGATLMLVAYLYFVSISLGLALIDLDTGRLPDAIVLPAYPVSVLALSASAFLMGEPVRIATAAAGAGILFGIYLLLASIWRGGMGMGDVKLAGVIGLYLGFLGWQVLAVGALAAFILGGVFGLALLVSRRARGNTAVPFGPWMLGGAWVGILVGPQVAGWYLGLFGLGVS